MVFQSWQKPFPRDIIAHAPRHLLPHLTRAAYRVNYHHAITTGATAPMYLPVALLPYIILATYIAVPHANPRREWLRRSRWLAFAAIWAIGVYQMLCMSPSRLAWAYCSGVAAMHLGFRAWHLLLNLDVQEEVLRVVRRPRARSKAHASELDNGNGAANGGVRQRKPFAANGDKVPKEEDHQDATDQYEYVWQGFPSEGSFLERFGWASDLIFSYRGSGWNISISPIPKPETTKIKPGDPVDVDSIPHVTKAGFDRCLTFPVFIRDRLLKFAISYLTVDILANLMLDDPYFVIGPEASSFYQGGLPHFLEVLPPLPRDLLRCACAILGVWAVLESYTAFADVALYLQAQLFFPSKAGIWTYASLFGSFDQVLDRGLLGMWGSFWHQTFRMSFLAPSTSLIKMGYLKEGSFAAMNVAALLSFTASSLFHAAGSMTSIPLTKPWRQVLFFTLQYVGIALQLAITSAAGKLLPARQLPPGAVVFVRRAFHLFFAMSWLFTTGSLFIDDVSTAGLWLCEPVPISLLKLLGVNTATDPDWWRWGPISIPPLPEGTPSWLSILVL